jgi:hypothetical protein
MMARLLTRSANARLQAFRDGVALSGVPCSIVEDCGDTEPLIAAGLHSSDPIATGIVGARERAIAMLKDEDFDYVWIIEDDVEFWSARHAATWMRLWQGDDADLVGFDVCRRSDDPSWKNWSLTACAASLPPDPTRAFMPLCRMSKRMVGAVCDYATTHGRLWFFETLFPSIAAGNGWRIVSIQRGGSVCRWRPVVGEAEARQAFADRAIYLHPQKAIASLPQAPRRG